MVGFKKVTLLFSVFCLVLCNISQPLFAATAPQTKHHHHKKIIAKHKIKSHSQHMVQKKISAPPEEKPVAVNVVPAYYNKTDSVPATTANPKMNFFIPTEKRLVNFVRTTVSNLRYSHYKLGGHHFDTNKGVYVLDCSNFVDNILREVSPHAYSSLVNATGADTPSTQHYYDFFSTLTNYNETFWNKVDSVEDLHPGDILVFRNKNFHGEETGGGHVMVVMDTPVRDTDIFFVRVADSAPSRHSQDTRQIHKSGIGIGTLLLRVNPMTGHPNAYAWGLGSYWNKNVNFAMARPIEISTLHKL